MMIGLKMPPQRVVARLMTFSSNSRSGLGRMNANRVGRALQRASIVVVPMRSDILNVRYSGYTCRLLWVATGVPAPVRSLRWEYRQISAHPTQEAPVILMILMPHNALWLNARALFPRNA